MNNSPPVIFLVFNRPELTRKVFEQIRAARPPVLLVVADGPRPEIPTDLERCSQVREIVAEVDWPCKVLRNYASQNLGCRERVSGGLTWAFDQVPEAMVLEDDCLPAPTFFSFCHELLNKYRHDSRIMHIGGCNFQGGKKRGKGSYYFSRYNHIWGWATWRRAWRHYDVTMHNFPQFRSEAQISGIVEERAMQRYWLDIFERVYSNSLLTWDYQWTYAMWQQNGLAILPNSNLVSNIGFGQDATHTSLLDKRFMAMPTFAIGPLVHPDSIVEDKDADRVTFKQFNPSRLKRLILLVGAQVRRFLSKCSKLLE